MKQKHAYANDYYNRPGITFDVGIEDPEKRIQAFLDSYQAGTQPEEGFDSSLMRDHLKLVSATGPPKVTATFKFKVVREFCNRMDNMHGGAVSLLFDMVTTMTMAPASRKDFWQFGGVSRMLSVTFLRPAPLGMDVLVECEVLQMGSRLATISGRMRSLVDGKLLSVAEHNKATVDLKTDSML